MATTPNFGLPLPPDTTYVADLAGVVRNADTIIDTVLKTQQDSVEQSAADAEAARIAAEEAASLVDAPAGAAILSAVQGPGDVRDELENSFASREVVATAKKQSQLYGTFFRRLRNGLPVIINAQGDSTTYGYDVVSADRIPAPTETLPDGSHHLRDRSPYPYPQVMQEKLREVYGLDNVTVINRGYSGDTTQTSFNRWIATSGAGLTLFSLGINDAVQDVGVDVFIEYYEKLILREINEYNSAVVLLSAFKQRTSSPSRVIDAYRTSVNALATKYGLPVIDAETWLGGYASDAFSDEYHMNTKGYGIIGSRAAALFIGEGPANPVHIGHGAKLGVRPTLDNVQYGPGSGIFNNGGGAGTVPEGNLNEGGVFARLAASAVYYSVYVDNPDTIVAVPHGIFAGATMTVELDFGIEQPHDLMNEFNNEPVDFAARAGNAWSYTANETRNYTGQERYERLLRIASPGWHTIKIHGDGVADVRLYALEFLTQSAFMPPAFRKTLEITTGTATYLPTYGRIGAEVTLDGAVAVPSAAAGQFYTVATLPIGYRPLKFSYYPTLVTSFGGTVQAYVRVQPTGEVQVAVSGVTGGAIMLNGVRFLPSQYK